MAAMAEQKANDIMCEKEEKVSRWDAGKESTDEVPSDIDQIVEVTIKQFLKQEMPKVHKTEMKSAIQKQENMTKISGGVSFH